MKEVIKKFKKNDSFIFQSTRFFVVGMRCGQCDQMLTLKVAQIYPNVYPKSNHSRVFFEVMLFLKTQKVTKDLG